MWGWTHTFLTSALDKGQLHTAATPLLGKNNPLCTEEEDGYVPELI